MWSRWGSEFQTELGLTDEANKNAAFQQILSEPHNQYPLEEYVKQTLLDATLSSIQLLDGQDNYQSSIEYPNGAFANPDYARTVGRS